jgi:hypothetical protein
MFATAVMTLFGAILTFCEGDIVVFVLVWVLAQHIAHTTYNRLGLAIG